jgi:hypothetical protein
MTDCATHRMRFETQSALAVEAAFDGGRITSDGGLLCVAKMDEELGLCEAISESVPEWRNRRGRHSLASLVRQRIFQIACGYEDQNDSDSLREDPLLKVVCGSLPESGRDLASQPTFSRLENAADGRSCRRMAQAIFELYLSERAEDGAAPKRVLLDFDATADPSHGDQEGSYYHGYYEQHIYHPLVVFDGESGHLIGALLRRGNTHASDSAVALLKRIVVGLKVSAFVARGSPLAYGRFAQEAGRGGSRTDATGHLEANSHHDRREGQRAPQECPIAPGFGPSWTRFMARSFWSLRRRS